jgi:hypothetical protein
LTNDVRERAKENGSSEWEAIKSDTDERGNTKSYSEDDEMTTVLLKLCGARTSTVWAYECTRDAM